MEIQIGVCSLCGGIVVKETGPWMGTTPPRARCTSCNAVEGPPTAVIPMRPRAYGDQGDVFTSPGVWDFSQTT